MSMIHILGRRINGTLGRYAKEFNDTEFRELVGDRPLPPGWVAWHIDKNELDRRSDRVKAIAKIPIITNDTILGGPVDPIPAYRESQKFEDAIMSLKK